MTFISRTCFHGKNIVGGGHHPAPPCHPARKCCVPPSSCQQQQAAENIRATVEASHARLHEACDALKNNPRKGGHEKTDLSQESLKAALEENKALCKRVSELIEIRQNLKAKVEGLEDHVKTLLGKKAGSSGGEVAQLIRNIEAQRDLYKSHVDRLLSKLDPKRSEDNLISKSQEQETKLKYTDIPTTNDENDGWQANTPKQQVLYSTHTIYVLIWRRIVECQIRG